MVQSEPIEFAPEWLAALHPRRGGRTARPPEFTDEHFRELHAAIEGHAAIFEGVVAHPHSDSELVALARAGDTSVEAVAAQIGLYSGSLYYHQATLAEQAVRELGLLGAIEACLRSLAIAVVHELTVEGSGAGRVVHVDALMSFAHSDEATRSKWAGHHKWVDVPTELLLPLRRRLSIVDEATYRQAIERVEPFRSGTPAQRWGASYLIPERHDWVLHDAAVGGGTVSPYVAFQPRQLGFFIGLDALVTVLDAMEHDAVPALIRVLDESFAWSGQDRKTIIGVLAHIPSDRAAAALLERIDLSRDAADGFDRVVAADPPRALRALEAGRDLAGASVLLARFRAAHPEPHSDVPDARSWPPDAPDDIVPTPLVKPPWMRPAPEPLVVPEADRSPRIDWRDGERDRWERWGPYQEDSKYRPEDGADFYLFGPTEVVRPHLAGWAAEKAWLYLRSPHLLVSRFELDAYPPVLRLARGKPVVGARLLLPYLSGEVAELMAGWLVGSRQFGSVAREWFDRHGVAAAVLLIGPAAAGGSPAASVAAQALARLDPDVVRAAGRELDAVDAVEQLLARDPLDVAPGRAVRLPRWLDLGQLPPVLTRDRRYALTTAHRTTLLQLLAQSRLDGPSPALSAVVEQIDPGSAASFGWALYGAWLLAGRSSKDAWAFDALGLLGDDAVAGRLAPRVRVWPSFGGAQRAKRGAEILGAMNSTTALGQLSVLARAAKSTPLRKHAALVLDRAAADRGLLPEQLDDLVAPDAGLDEPIYYRGVEYTTALDQSYTLVLAAADGGIVTKLPAPASDEEKNAVSRWNRMRCEAKRSIAAERRRLEQAMVTQRSWTRREFTDMIVGHPLLGRLARGLIWTVDGRPSAVDALGDLVDIDGGLLADGGSVRIAHPASADLSAWQGSQQRRGVAPLFPQLERDVFDGDPSRYWHTVVTVGSLYGLTRRGWHWSDTGHAATRTGLIRPLNSHTSVILGVAPGVIASLDPRDQTDQRIERLSLHSTQHELLSLFTDLPRATRSELLRELSTLEIVDTG